MSPLLLAKGQECRGDLWDVVKEESPQVDTFFLMMASNSLENDWPTGLSRKDFFMII